MTVAIQTAFLMDGFNRCHQHKFGHSAAGADTYETHSENHNGYIGIVESMEAHAEFVDQALDDYITAYFVLRRVFPNYPGVFEYEVTESLGEWLFNNPDCFDSGVVTVNFEIEVVNQIKSWFEPNQQPVAAATQPESTTMTVSELIARLKELDPALPILTRGSESTKMVDALSIRVVKTKKRSGVFIGKPKAETT